MSELLINTKKINTGCIVWLGQTNKGGYGTKTIGSRADGTRSSKLVHRLSYELTHGHFNEQLCVLHTCDNPPCLNPEHLFLGTRADNHADMLKKNRRVNLKGEDRPNHKLTETEVKHIKKSLSNGIQQKVLAKQYNVNQTLISAIKTNKVWTHIN